SPLLEDQHQGQGHATHGPKSEEPQVQTRFQANRLQKIGDDLWLQVWNLLVKGQLESLGQKPFPQLEVCCIVGNQNPEGPEGVNQAGALADLLMVRQGELEGKGADQSQGHANG